MMEYGHFPQGWVLSHDPTVGINSDVDPMPGYTPASPPNGGGPSGFRKNIVVTWKDRVDL